MPIITVTLIAGYEQSVRTALCERLSDAAHAVTGAPTDGVTVVVNEVPAGNYMRGRQHRNPGRPPESSSDLVRTYLAALETRDLEAARALLQQGFSMTFPGGVVMHSLEDLIAWASARYREIRKTYSGFDEMESEHGSVVYCHGTLMGETLDGKAFSGVRFVDRFTVRDGGLVDQAVWNDLAEVGVVACRPMETR